ncbi:MAG: type II toxin-antitoxin system HicA family toxin [Acidobacteriia bacterium]|nr:type II toxin-antitoxin system HicA family toxin [Terriglobia bacterium]
MYRAADHRALTVPMHFSKTIPRGTLHAVIKQAGFTTAQFVQLMED